MDKLSIGMILRYLLIVIAGMFNLYIFYAIFTPLTLNLSVLGLSFFGEVIKLNNAFLFDGKLIQLVEACIAGSAYYLLFVLSMSVRAVSVIKRVGVILFLFLSLLIFNVARIVFFSMITDSALFEELHLLTWYLISLLFVIGIWFLSVKIFKIKSIPIVDDFKFLLKQTKSKKRRR